MRSGLKIRFIRTSLTRVSEKWAKNGAQKFWGPSYTVFRCGDGPVKGLPTYLYSAIPLVDDWSADPAAFICRFHVAFRTGRRCWKRAEEVDRR